LRRALKKHRLPLRRRVRRRLELEDREQEAPLVEAAELMVFEDNHLAHLPDLRPGCRKLAA